jgi:hypothetical protein
VQGRFFINSCIHKELWTKGKVKVIGSGSPVIGQGAALGDLRCASRGVKMRELGKME